jgi:hypothetical protein
MFSTSTPKREWKETMTYFQETISAKTNRDNLLARFWLNLVKGLQRDTRARPVRKKPKFPNSGMPISNEVVTKLSIRSGFTAGPW